MECPADGQTVVVKRGRRGWDYPEVPNTTAPMLLNKGINVTWAQMMAMRCGAERGFHTMFATCQYWGEYPP